MIPVFLYGRRDDDEITEGLISALSKNGGVLYINNSMINSTERSPQFLLHDTPSQPFFNMQRGIIVFKQKVSRFTKFALPQDFICIVDSNNEAALHLLKNNNSQALTCGTNPRDTLSISSISDEAALIGLQRDITGFFGEKIEAGEFLVKNESGITKEAFLPALAIILLSSKNKKEFVV